MNSQLRRIFILFAQNKLGQVLAFLVLLKIRFHKFENCLIRIEEFK